MRNLLIFLLAASGACAAAPRLDDIKLPPGFRISIYAEGMERSRSLAKPDATEQVAKICATVAGSISGASPEGKQ